ncbi:MAG: hypothetical protein ABIL58_24680 [Pseudomonadota bacterium]
MNTVVIKFSVQERELLFSLMHADPGLTERLRTADMKNNLISASYTVEELEDLLDAIAAEANYTPDEQVQKQLDRIADKIEEILFELQRL